ncbi:hypothetical protein [Alkalibacterium sp. 20]|uniref:hypothetical protein n=1 Tax=Alkalibacterium sp. 20 TaxID=1798803 RepID=UPI000B28E15F
MEHSYKNGTFCKIEKAYSVEGALDVEGKLVSAPFVEPHIHLDTTLTAGGAEMEREWYLIRRDRNVD